MSTPPEPPRASDPHLELLSVLGSIGVVLVHASMSWTGWLDLRSQAWWLANFGNAAGRFGSSVFVMITGAVLLQRPSEHKPLAFIWQRWRRLLPVLAFWSLMYLAWRELAGEHLDTGRVLHDLSLGIPGYHLWFLFMLMGLYVWIPLLRAVVGPADRRVFQYTLLALLALATWACAALQSAAGLQTLGSLGFSPLFIVYLMGGYLLYRDRPRIPAPVLAAVQAVSVAGMVMGVGVLYAQLGAAAFTVLYNNRTAFAMALAFSLFIRAMQLPAEHPLLRQARRLAPYTFGIYVLHPFWLDVLGFVGVDSDNEEWVLAGLAAYLLSAATAAGMLRIRALRRVML